MGREGWIYTIAFLAILGVGAMIILPRLERPARQDGADGDAPFSLEVDPPPREAGPGVESFEGHPEYEWYEVTVRAPKGSLRGPLKQVFGAQVEALGEAGARVHRLRLRPLEAHVHFGAAGHQWVALPVGELKDGLAIELPRAAAPIVLRVRERDGRPASDVPVRVLPSPPGETLRTDAGGTLVLDFLPTGLVHVDLDSAERSGPRRRLLAGVDRDVRVEMDPPWAVVGRLLATDGSPLAGATVAGFGPQGHLGSIVSTDGDGRFRWSGPAVVRLALRFRASGWGEEAVEVAPPAVGPLETDAGEVRMRQAGVILDGTVKAAFREPDAYVTVEPAVTAIVREIFGTGHVLDEARRIPLGADGRFRFHDLPANLPLRVAVRGAGVPLDLIVRGEPGEEIPARLEPTSGEWLVGTLAYPDGRPAAGVRLLLSSVPRDGNRVERGDVVLVAGADGSFHERGLTWRTAYLRAYAPGWRSLLQQVRLPLEAPLELTFEAAVKDADRVLEGRVYGALRTETQGTATDPRVGEHARVIFDTPLAGVEVRAAGVTTRTDSDGGFRLEGVESLAPTVALVYGYAPGPNHQPGTDPRPFVASRMKTVAPGGQALSLVLEQSAALRFRAVDAIDDRPAAFVHIVLRADGGQVLVDRGVVPRDGVVLLSDLPPGGVSLAVFAEGRRLERAPIRLIAGKTKDLGAIRLGHGMRVVGRVVDAKGRALSHARVGAYGKGWQQVGQAPHLERELLFRTARTGADGRFVIEGFDPRKPADLAVWATGYAPTAVRIALPRLSESFEVEVEVKLVLGGYLALDLRETSRSGGLGPRIPGASIDIEYARDGTDYLDLVHHGLLGGLLGSSEEWADASRHLLYEQRGSPGYVVGPLRPGPYELWVERAGYKRLRRKLTVIDPTQAVLIDLVRNEERKLDGRLTRLGFEMERR